MIERETILESEVEYLRARVAALEAEASTDPLTGLLNRRGLDAAYHRMTRRVSRTGSQVTVALLDVDHFKRFNDQYGHAQGDAALKRLAARLTAGARAEDAAARVGGEEFVLLVEGTPALTQTILKRLKAPGVPRFSAGVAGSGGGYRDLGEMLERADRALYAAKAAGRNQVRIAA